MKSLINTVKRMSVKAKVNGNTINFLDHANQDPGCLKLIESMNRFSLKELGIEGPEDPYHF